MKGCPYYRQAVDIYANAQKSNKVTSIKFNNQNKDLECQQIRPPARHVSPTISYANIVNNKTSLPNINCENHDIQHADRYNNTYNTYNHNAQQFAEQHQSPPEWLTELKAELINTMASMINNLSSRMNTRIDGIIAELGITTA
ncbi:hypothetical protein PV327_005044 [Microctonus hyperodae]|uniref:Uncharacterized protein n=1 Tax=Microctonus hyperodae TaxID=165561 RepID=A0AA39G0J8_MICHY|nr:hypothetical protein PV327_005044 [Microctonus hyperodae]